MVSYNSSSAEYPKLVQTVAVPGNATSAYVRWASHSLIPRPCGGSGHFQTMLRVMGIGQVMKAVYV